MYRALVRFYGLALLLFCACRQSGTTSVKTPGTIADPVCGDGHLDPGEACDGSDLGTATCQSRGFDRGQLACDSRCQLVETLCEKRCGNGVVDVGESCDADAGVTACVSFGYHVCSPSCQLDTSHCVTTALEDGPAFFMANGGPAVVGDLPPVGAKDLVVAVPSFGRVETFPWLVQQGFQQTQGRKLSFETTPRSVSVADLDADGLNDVITISDDGSIDALIAKASDFSKAPATSQRCIGGHFIAPTVLSCGPTVLVLRDGGATPVAASIAAFTGDVWSASSGTLRQFAAPELTDGGVFSLALDPTEIALGDLDGDGDLDFAAVAAGAVTVLERSNNDFAMKKTFNAPGANHLWVVDLDLDGRPDLLWLAGGEVIIQRNNGGFLFTELRGAAGTGALVSFSIGDVDADGDLDLALTYSQGGEATRTNVKLNRVR